MACNQGCERACTGGQSVGLGQPVLSVQCGRNTARQKILVDTIPQTDLINNRRHTPDLSLAELRDPLGRHALVEAIELVWTKDYTEAAASDVVFGRELLQSIANIFVEDVSGWQYVTGIDGRQVRDLPWLRSKRLRRPDPDALPLNGNQTETIAMNLVIPFNRRNTIGGLAVRGAIPLSALIARGRSAFRFQTINGIASAPTGVTDDGFTSDMDVWLHLYYPGDACLAPDQQPLMIPPMWQVEEYTETKTSGSLRHCERATDFGAIRYQEEDTGGLSLAAYSAMNVQQSGYQSAHSLTNAEMIQQTFMQVADVFFEDEQLVDADGEEAFSLPVQVGANLQVYYLADMQKHGPEHAGGVISYKFTRTAAQTVTRFLHQTVQGQTQRRTTMLRRAACMPEAQPVFAMSGCGCKIMDPRHSPTETLRVGPVVEGAEAPAPLGTPI